MDRRDFARWASCGIAEEQAEAAFSEWEVVPLVINGVERGGAIVSGTEIHFALAPQWRHRTITKARARDFLAPLLDRSGFLTTRALAGAGHESFLTRLGFRLTWSDGAVDHYMLCSPPFEAAQKAQGG